ncbi:hypothetical protein KUV47_05225 [Vannielia litorea]|uniref:hypothetical protein n=1 Tax=Vannielia TaxID=2813041 RepID=UPI001C9440A3|nr:hypothetical protein [Vannielia litorea]MBY6047458.1 hypothetical protein [Vannielia litorea]MBY6074872.1 hypothetical protein [Vannielia litorea]MBY6152607.1 hypothetical protein [Vannielia litorea]
MKAALIAAFTTGAFCAVFAVGVDQVAGMLPLGAVVLVSFVSGFLGSLFARFVWRQREK